MSDEEDKYQVNIFTGHQRIGYRKYHLHKIFSTSKWFHFTSISLIMVYLQSTPWGTRKCMFLIRKPRINNFTAHQRIRYIIVFYSLSLCPSLKWLYFTSIAGTSSVVVYLKTKGSGEQEYIKLIKQTFSK